MASALIDSIGVFLGVHDDVVVFSSLRAGP